MPRVMLSIVLPFATRGRFRVPAMAVRPFIEITFVSMYHLVVFYANKMAGSRAGRVKFSDAGYGPDFSRLRTVRGTLSLSSGRAQLQLAKAHTPGSTSI